MTKTLAITDDGKGVRFAKKTYPLVLGFKCPYSGEPVALLMKARATVFRDALESGQHLVSEGDYAGIVFHESNTDRYVSLGKVSTEDGEDDNYQKVRYFYGLKEDPLIEWVLLETGTKRMKASSFREKLFDGKLPNYRVSHELTEGKDILIAYLKDGEA
ncbi:MAG: hypothetical protein C0402_05455 [Thermodesulfovibrio sp.]|nr:hypothetical protein [Thermodesulfovibrio sp.]